MANREWEWLRCDWCKQWRWWIVHRHPVRVFSWTPAPDPDLVYVCSAACGKALGRSLVSRG